MADCIFCRILAGIEPASFVYRDEHCSAFMDILPINPGHVLVIPNRHAASLAELDPEDGAHLFRVAQRIAAAVRVTHVQCEGVNLFLADGAAAGQEVFHVHLHVLPRFASDGFGFRRSSYGAPARSELDTLADLIEQHLPAQLPAE